MRIRRKPVWQWEPLPYGLSILLLLGAGTLGDAHAGVWYLLGAVCAVLGALALLSWAFLRARKRRVGPDVSGDFRSVDDVQLVEAAKSANPPVMAAATARCRHGIDAAAARTRPAPVEPDGTDLGRAAQARRVRTTRPALSAQAAGVAQTTDNPKQRLLLRAILVPGSSAWWGLRSFVAVQLLAGGAAWRGGELPLFAASRWEEPLTALRRQGVFVTVPARIDLGTAPFTVELDLGGLEATLNNRGILAKPAELSAPSAAHRPE